MKHERKDYIEIKDNPKATHLKVSLYYSMGGMNYFTGTNERRGIWLSVSPVTRTVYPEGGSSEGYTAFTGVKECLKEMARFNQNTFDRFSIPETNLERMIDHVCEKNGIPKENLTK
jgi:hypothetical protein